MHTPSRVSKTPASDDLPIALFKEAKFDIAAKQTLVFSKLCGEQNAPLDRLESTVISVFKTNSPFASQSQGNQFHSSCIKGCCGCCSPHVNNTKRTTNSWRAGGVSVWWKMRRSDNHSLNYFSVNELTEGRPLPCPRTSEQLSIHWTGLLRGTVCCHTVCLKSVFQSPNPSTIPCLDK